jgi:hypothetical protein
MAISGASYFTLKKRALKSSKKANKQASLNRALMKMAKLLKKALFLYS